MSEANITKKCSRCIWKPISEFYKDPKSRDGMTYYCKSCIKKAATRYSKTEKSKIWHAAYAKTDKFKRNKAEYQKTDAGKLVVNKGFAKYRAKNQIKRKAQRALGYAVEVGRIIKPSVCSECPSKKRIEGHHDDYLFPDIVRWLCRVCHVDWHKLNGPGLNG